MIAQSIAFIKSRVKSAYEMKKALIFIDAYIEIKSAIFQQMTKTEEKYIFLLIPCSLG